MVNNEYVKVSYSIEKVKKLINNKDIQYIYVLKESTLSSETETFIKNL